MVVSWSGGWMGWMDHSREISKIKTESDLFLFFGEVSLSETEIQCWGRGCQTCLYLYLKIPDTGKLWFIFWQAKSREILQPKGLLCFYRLFINVGTCKNHHVVSLKKPKNIECYFYISIPTCLLFYNRGGRWVRWIFDPYPYPYSYPFPIGMLPIGICSYGYG